MASLQHLPLKQCVTKRLGLRQDSGRYTIALREYASSSAPTGCSGTSSVVVVAKAKVPSSSSSLKSSPRLEDAGRFVRETLKESNHQLVADKKIRVIESIERFFQDGRCKQTAMAAALFLALSLVHEEAGRAEAMVQFVPVAFPWENEAKVQLEPSKGTCATCIGVVDETLGACNATANCVSSFDDREMQRRAGIAIDRVRGLVQHYRRPRFFVAPWEFPGQLPSAVEKLRDVLLNSGAKIEEQGERYVHAVFISNEGVMDDVEFLFSNPREDATVVVRSASRAINMDDKQRNRKRLEEIRKSLTWEQVPVLRNRKRAFFFLESPWDTFGPEPPPSYDYKDSKNLDFVPE